MATAVSLQKMGRELKMTMTNSSMVAKTTMETSPLSPKMVFLGLVMSAVIPLLDFSNNKSNNQDEEL